MAYLVRIFKLCRKTAPLTWLNLLFAATLAQGADNQANIRFNRDIRPILSQNCFACHGPDDNAREADLRLDIKEGLFGPVSDGVVISASTVRNHISSILLKRIKSSDPDLRMPPVDSGKKLSAEQIEVLERWIASGAEWQGHWSYIPPTRPDVPEVEAIPPAIIQNDIDRFMQAKLREQQLKPSAAADRVTLIRGDIFDPAIKIGEASVVTLYLLQSLNEKLMPRLKGELKKGSRVVSHAFSMGPSWPAEKSEQVDGTMVYFWTIQ